MPLAVKVMISLIASGKLYCERMRMKKANNVLDQENNFDFTDLQKNFKNPPEASRLNLENCSPYNILKIHSPICLSIGELTFYN